MLDALFDPWAGEIGRRALIEVLVLALACGPLGVWVVLFRQSYAAESMAHAALPGLVLVTLAGLPLLIGAAAGLLIAAGLIALAQRGERTGSDVSVSVVVTTLFGGGVLLALHPEVPADLGEVLFGDPLSVTQDEIAATAVLALLVLLALGGLHRKLTITGFDPQGASSLGSSRATGALLLALLAVVTMMAVGALGNLLAVALIVAPAAAALQLTRRLGPALAASVGLAALSGIAGLYASYHLELAAGASIALAAVAVFAVAALAGATPPGRRRLTP